jgi:hypothetical protein
VLNLKFAFHWIELGANFRIATLALFATVFTTGAARRFPLGAEPCYGHLMGEDRLLAAIERIDGALARIESAAANPGQAPAAATAPDDGRTQALEAAHRALRTRVQGAIALIDRLLESEPR